MNDRKRQKLETNRFIARKETQKQRTRIALIQIQNNLSEDAHKAERQANSLTCFTWFHWLTDVADFVVFSLTCVRFCSEDFGWVSSRSDDEVCASSAKFTWQKFRNANLRVARIDCTWQTDWLANCQTDHFIVWFTYRLVTSLSNSLLSSDKEVPIYGIRSYFVVKNTCRWAIPGVRSERLKFC